MRKLSTSVHCLFIAAAAVAAPTANEDFVVAEDAKTYTNAVNAANAYTDGKISEIPVPDFSTNNTELVETIQETAPMPDNYANASMPARLRMSLPEDSEFIEPVSIFDTYSFVFDDMPGKPRVVFRNGAFYIDCEYGGAVGNRDDFEGTVSFYLPDTPFEYYEFRYRMSPVATIEKVDLTAQALANTIDYSTNNTELVETITTKAPAPGNYAVVSNAAMNAVQTETDPVFDAWTVSPQVDHLDIVGTEFPTGMIPSSGNYSTYSWRWYRDYVAITRNFYQSHQMVSNQTVRVYLPDHAEIHDNDTFLLYSQVPSWAKAASKPSYTAAEIGATTPADVTAAIREQSLGGIWDAELQVWWTPVMRNGSLTYQATTNVNLNAEN